MFPQGMPASATQGQVIATQILTNISTLAQLVRDAAMTSVVRDWLRNKHEMEKAFEWVAFGQKLAQSLAMSSGLPNLHQKMDELNRKFDPGLPYPINMDLLRHGMDRLIEAIVHNPYTTSTLLFAMTDLVKARYAGQVSTPLSQLPAAQLYRAYNDHTSRQQRCLASELMNNHRLMPFEKDNREILTKTNQLLEALISWQQTSHNSLWFQVEMNNVLNKVSYCCHGWSVLVNALGTDLSKVEVDKRQQMRGILSLILLWIFKQYRAEANMCPIWQVPPQLMADIAELNTQFRDWYIETLQEIGDRLDTDNVLFGRQHYSFSSSSSSFAGASAATSTFHDNGANQLVRRFMKLLTKDQETKNRVLTLLNNKSRVHRLTIWGDIATEVIQFFST